MHDTENMSAIYCLIIYEYIKNRKTMILSNLFKNCADDDFILKIKQKQKTNYI